ncbi:molybdopterin molybdotransferase MoeA [Methylomonas sp. MgM2]
MTDFCYPGSAGLLSAEEAISSIIYAIETIQDQESIDLFSAKDRVLANTIKSPIHIPPHRNAAMDGYAFSNEDIVRNQAFKLRIAGTAWAGKPFNGPVASNQCVRIFTGALVPNFADSVIAQERLIVDGEYVTFPDDTQPFKNIRAIGSDVKKQDPLIVAPKKLNSSDLGLLAAAGIANITVYRRLNIGFFSTGDELVGIGQALQPGQIYDSNRYLLAAMLNDPNHSVTDLGVIKDDPQSLENALMGAANKFDVLISTGGASVGDADFVKQTLEKCGQVNFWKLAIKPGKPLAFGKIGNCWFFGLPGNPAAVLVTYQQFVKPALLRLAGAPPTQALQLRARCETSLRKSPGRKEYQRGILSQVKPGEFAVKLAGPQDSHQLKVASLANCFIILDQDCSGVEAGQMVTVEPFENRI